MSLTKFETHQLSAYYLMQLICNYTNDITIEGEKEMEELKFR